MSLGFWYGGGLIATGEYNMFQFFLCFYTTIFGIQSAGRVFSFVPDMGKAKSAAQELKWFFDRQPEIGSSSSDGEILDQVDGLLEFRDVNFRYPTRPGVPVLRGLNLTVKPGQYVALVGTSGCGKSTVLALLERFYKPLSGGIYLDDKEISHLNLDTYRKFFALVSQEPTLYHGTIRDNVLLGTDRDDIDEASMMQVCKDANIYDFVSSLP
jgi:ATP-binding cassette subfamily B (MDR/TAP) protein 1